MEWIKIADLPVGDAPLIAENGIARLEVNGQKLLLANHKGQYFATVRKCPHAGGALTNGWLNDCGHIVCPLHRYTFDMETGKNTSGEGFFLQTYPIEMRSDGFYIGLPKQKKWWQFW